MSSGKTSSLKSLGGSEPIAELPSEEDASAANPSSIENLGTSNTALHRALTLINEMENSDTDRIEKILTKKDLDIQNIDQQYRSSVLPTFDQPRQSMLIAIGCD